MNEKVTLIRRASTISRERAVQNGFGDKNVQRMSPMDRRTPPPGVFFATLEEGNKERFEDQAKEYSQRAKREPMVVQLGITPETFPILRGRIYRMRTQAGDPLGETSYQKVTDFDTIHRLAPVVVDMQGLPHEDLLRLDLSAGFLTPEGTYDYRSYADWSTELGVRARTREEIEAGREGLPPGFRK